MSKVIRIVRENALLVAMLIGALLYKWLSPLAFLSPYLIAIMLFFTFCKVNPATLRLRAWHFIMLAFQMIISLLIYLALRPIDILLAQGVMLCVFMPTATAAAVITGKLGGNIKEITTYTLLTNLLTAFLAPAIFPIIHTAGDLTFWQGAWIILQKIGPILILPFLLAWFTRIIYIKTTDKPFVLHKTLAAFPFYVWVFALAVLIAKTVYSLVHDDYSIYAVMGMAIGSLMTCILQFIVGKRLGAHYDKKGETGMQIALGQSLGQKNTMLAIWMAQAYLIPIASFAPAAYVIFQNLFNAWQLNRAMKKRT